MKKPNLKAQNNAPWIAYHQHVAFAKALAEVVDQYSHDMEDGLLDNAYAQIALEHEAAIEALGSLRALRLRPDRFIANCFDIYEEDEDE